MTDATTTENAQPLALPELHERALDAEALAAYEADLTAEAQVDAVMVKGGAEVRATDAGELGLAEAFATLRGGRVRAVQVRYRWGGEAWWDTVMAMGSGHGAGYRIVRLRAESLPWEGGGGR
jgi:hypothetical protein